MSINNNNKKVLLFGSFTEDDIRSWQDEKPVEKKELKFGSLNCPTGITFGNFNGELSSQRGSTDGKVSFGSANSAKKDKEKDVKDVKSVKNSEPGILGSPKQNGSVAKFAHSDGVTIGNGVKDLKLESLELNSLPFSQNEDNVVNQSLSSSFHVLDGGPVKDGDVERANNELAYVKVENTRKLNNGPVAAMRDLLPRGLINSGNLCFLNASLQAFLSCYPFVQLLQDLRNRDIPKAGFPTLTAFVEFLFEFDVPSSCSLKKDTAIVETGRPFSPAMFEGILKKFTPDVPNSISGRPRQEDAQEFLSFVMDQMHDELLKLEGQFGITNGAKTSLVSSTEDDEWETVGPKNKSAVTRTQNFPPSELSHIFGGQLRSVVKTKGNTDSATVQPFLLLHLDIYPEAVRTIKDALHLFAAPENLEGYRASAAGKAGVVTARKSVKIQTLSKIMILHLMRFSYGTQGSTKLHKPVHFPLELVLGRELLFSPSTQSRKYELVATITHHGREPSKGHYTADTRSPKGHWLRFDDASVTTISTSKVLHDQAYVLFYKQV
ncbi:ubiquitin carboxyl-terminal hydrolase 24 [Mercurialis annua]|uniref:ubiquitin carboxyl-terminal hydrolase 24 n=1 Tax=Mercurialis annua TaxID=3986 RepID=UPI00215ED999|nr:ubiquitin carboxyl-terminal hydrolase 24 [Mercurialis annua]